MDHILHIKTKRHIRNNVRDSHSAAMGWCRRSVSLPWCITMISLRDSHYCSLHFTSITAGKNYTLSILTYLEHICVSFLTPHRSHVTVTSDEWITRGVISLQTFRHVCWSSTLHVLIQCNWPTAKNRIHSLVYGEWNPSKFSIL